MKKTTSLIIVLLLTVCVIPAIQIHPVEAADTLIDSQTAQTTTNYINAVFPSSTSVASAWADTFTSRGDDIYVPTYATVQLRRVNSFGSNCYVAVGIWEVSGGVPVNDYPIALSDKIQANSISTTAQNYDFYFTGVNRVPQTPSTTYAIGVLITEGTISTGLMRIGLAAGDSWRYYSSQWNSIGNNVYFYLYGIKAPEITTNEIINHVTSEKCETDTLYSYWYTSGTKFLSHYQFYIDNGNGTGYLPYGWTAFASNNNSWANMSYVLDQAPIGSTFQFYVTVNNTAGTETNSDEQSFTIQATVHFYFDSGGYLDRNGTSIANGTTTVYTSEQGVLMRAVVTTGGYAWLNYTWTGHQSGSSTTNPQGIQIINGTTIWCYFAQGSFGAGYLVSSFAWSPTAPDVDEFVSFDGSNSQSDSVISDYSWDFGDGNITSGNYQTINHIYATKGIFNATLTVTSDFGSVEFSHGIPVGLGATVIYGSYYAEWNFSDYEILNGTYISGNIDSLAEVDGDVLQIQEEATDAGYNILYNLTDVPQNTTALIIYCYGAYVGSPTHQLLLELYNYETTQWINLGQLPYTGTYTWVNASLYLSDEFNLTQCINPSGNMTVRMYQPQAGNPTHMLYVDQLHADIIYPQVVAASPYTFASFTWSPANPDIDQTITFDATSSLSSGSILNYSWDFGDSNITSGSYQTIEHFYSVNGTYTVTLTVTSDVGENSINYDIGVGLVGATTVNAYGVALIFLIFGIIFGIIFLIIGLKRRNSGDSSSSNTMQFYQPISSFLKCYISCE